MHSIRDIYFTAYRIKEASLCGITLPYVVNGQTVPVPNYKSTDEEDCRTTTDPSPIRIAASHLLHGVPDTTNLAEVTELSSCPLYVPLQNVAIKLFPLASSCWSNAVGTLLTKHLVPMLLNVIMVGSISGVSFVIHPPKQPLYGYRLEGGELNGFAEQQHMPTLRMVNT